MHDLRSKLSVGSLLIVLALVIPLTSGTMSENAAAAAASQSTFASPEEAGKALVEAAKSGDENAVLAVFGPDSKEIIYSGDATQDKKTAAEFVSAYQVMNRWRKIDDNNEMLIIGADNFTFPIPLKKNASGRWYFDTAAGREEILSRRIGRNELAAIEVSQSLADAQHEYYSQNRGNMRRKQYALKFVSDKGTHDGLYWDSAEGQPRSPLGPLVAFATGEGYKVQPQSHQPFHGYYFHIMKRQGKNAPGGAKDYVSGGKMVRGFAFVAYPAVYGKSGIMTFIINQNGVVYQKDLGKDTDRIASKMTTFNPDKTWTQVQV
jgi:Protein of unknown function (DUF2950)